MNNIFAMIEIGWPFRNAIIVAGVALLAFVFFHAAFASMTPKKRPVARRGWIAGLVYFVFAALVVALTATSFGSILVNGIMERWTLLAHISIAGAFVFVMLVFAVVWNPNYVLQASEGSSVLAEAKTKRWWLSTWSLWAVLFASLVVAGSMLFQMLPVLDTEAMLEVTELHRYSGLALAAALAVHFYSMLVQRIGWR